MLETTIQLHVIASAGNNEMTETTIQFDKETLKATLLLEMFTGLERSLIV